MNRLITRTERAMSKRRGAVRMQHRVEVGKRCSEDEDFEETRLLAQGLHIEADDLLRPEHPVIVVQGEVVDENPATTARAAFADTLARPNQIGVDASAARLDLLNGIQTDTLALGVDAAHSIGATNSMEKMLAHQLAKAHQVCMRLMDQAMTAKEGGDRVGLLNASARFMDVYQRGLLTIHRVRTGGSQTVVVKHVTVRAGAKAVIGNVKTGGRGRSRNGR